MFSLEHSIPANAFSTQLFEQEDNFFTDRIKFRGSLVPAPVCRDATLMLAMGTDDERWSTALSEAGSSGVRTEKKERCVSDGCRDSGLR